MLLKIIQKFFKIAPKGMIIVTGSDSSHFKSAMQLITSVKKHEPKTPVIFYDLGLSPDQIVKIKTLLHEKDEYICFDYSRYPDYFNIKVKAGEYAWKPVIVQEVLERFQKKVCWMDAGNIITEPLYKIRDTLDQYGFYSPKTSGTIKEWTHPAMLKRFGVDSDEAMLGKINLNGAVVAVDYSNETMREMIRQWSMCAQEKECIAPEGSSRENHRQDQSVLTILAYINGVADVIPKKYLGFKIHQDVD